MSFPLRWGVYQPNLPRSPREDWEAGRMCVITQNMSSSDSFYPRKRAGLPGSIPNREAKEVMGFPPGFRIPSKMIGEAVPPPYAKLIADRAMEILERGKGDAS